MRRLACWTLFAALVSCVALSAASAPPPSAPSSTAMKDLQRNLTLGSELLDRQGTPEELRSLQDLADRGLKSARESVAKNPTSPEAHHLLGSWLLYSYRVVRVDRITYDADGEERVDKVQRVVQGLSKDQTAGLAAFKQARDLAPRTGRYLVEYGAALVHCNRSTEASGILKTAWTGDLRLTPQQKVRTALLLSDIDAARGDAGGARGWLYRALTENPENLGIVERLRKLDARAPSRPAATEEEEQPAASEEEAAPADQTTQDEGIIVGGPESEVSSDEQQPVGGAVEEAPQSDQSDQQPAASDSGSDSSD